MNALVVTDLSETGLLSLGSVAREVLLGPHVRPHRNTPPNALKP